MNPTDKKPFFQRRHYEFIADTIREMNVASLVYTRNDLAEEFAKALARTNTSFDRGTFIEACRPDTEYRNRSRSRK